MMVVQVSTAALILAVLTGSRGFDTRPNGCNGGGDFQSLLCLSVTRIALACPGASFASASSKWPESARWVLTPSADFKNP